MKPSILLSLIKSLQPKLEAGQALGVLSQSRWQGPRDITVDDQVWRVLQCDSVLELRESLSEDSSAPLVLVTALPTSLIEDDVRVRLLKQQLMPVDPWNTLADRFKARQVDPALRQSTILADAALESLDENATPVAGSGVLTAEAVWQVILQNRLGLEHARPDLQDFLSWMTFEGAAARWDALGSAVQQALVPWLAFSLGNLAPILVRSLVDGYGSDAIAVGFVLGALVASGADSRAMGRLERYAGNQPISDDNAKRWSDAAEQWARRGSMEQVRQELSRADVILEGIGALDSAINSQWSPIGFQQRLQKFAGLLGGVDRSKCQQAFALISNHAGARSLEELRGRRERAEMAMRLIRWMGDRTGLASRLAESIMCYEQEGSWLDWARNQLLAGDESEGVTRAYRKLFDLVTVRREEENRRFGELLVAATAENFVPPDILVVEEVLKVILLPLIKLYAGGVLFIVMDGMSLPVWRELAPDLSRHGWLEWAPSVGSFSRSALTTLPPVTAFSRCSLLCGALVSGSQGIEKRGFQERPEFRSARPSLFHKDEVGSSGVDLGESLRLAISGNDSKLVGVVLNVIDDSLAGPEQLSIQWNLRSIAVLQALLSEAKSAGRVVVLASDHGHVLDHGSTLVRKVNSADRWRPVSGETDPTDKELLVTGNRVLAEGERMIAPTSENLRYTPNRRNGYHGGLTPQECIAPIAVLAPALMGIEGWEVRSDIEPSWWSDGETVQSEQVKVARKTSRKPDPQGPSLLLFGGSAEQKDWVRLLVASDVFKEQMQTFSGRLKQEQIERSLQVLSDHNLVIMKGAFAQKLGLTNLRVDGLLASLQRILNLEGYAVLSVDPSQTIRLNLSLLRDQFELRDSDER